MDESTELGWVVEPINPSDPKSRQLGSIFFPHKSGGENLFLKNEGIHHLFVIIYDTNPNLLHFFFDFLRGSFP